jgi:sulfatase modifying factor 1
MRKASVLGLAMLLHAAGVAAGGDMVRVPGGDSRIGSDHGRADEAPSFFVHVDPFDLDRTPVTVADFAEFAARAHYVTQAEKLGSSAVMTFGTGQWSLVPGANWRKPEGPQGPAAQAAHPVTHVSWNDAANYCAASGKRLPTEIEFEHATHAGAPASQGFAFGSELVKDGKYRANVWTGVFPVINTAADGFRTTSPVGAFGAGPLGLTDMAGNVWEWTRDWYRPYAEREQAWTGGPQAEKVQRGGSFLCDPKFCYGFRATARGHATPDSSHMHVGFRCAKDLKGSSS